MNSKSLFTILMSPLLLLFLVHCKLGDNAIKGSVRSVAPSGGSQPGAVSGVSLTVLSDQSIQLDWSASGDVTPGFVIAYMAGSTPPASCNEGTLISSSEISSTTHQVDSLTEEQSYSFRICALDEYDQPIEATSQTATSTTFAYCHGSRLTNSPYANSGEAGIDGSDEENAFRICSPSQFNEISAQSSDWTKYFILKSDLNYQGLPAYANISIGTGPGVSSFSGTFDGQFHVIRNILLYFAGFSESGLFGVVDSGGVVKNLGLVNMNLFSWGPVRTGAIVGAIYSGTVENVYVLGHIDVGSSRVGGLVGQVGVGGTLKNSFAVTSQDMACCTSTLGGAVGYNEGTLLNTYAVSHVTALNNSPYIGGLVGYNDTTGVIENSFAIATVDGSTTGNNVGSFSGVNTGTITNSFYDNQRPCNNIGTGNCSAQTATGINTSLTPDYFSKLTNEPMASWPAGVFKEVAFNGVPIFAAQTTPPLSNFCWEKNRVANYPFANSPDGPSGLDDNNALRICSVKQQLYVGSASNTANLDKYYRLDNDLNFDYIHLTKYVPIGTAANPFTGQFNGQGYSIYNIDFSGHLLTEHVGFVGSGQGGLIKKLGLVNCTFSISAGGNGDVGLFVGRGLSSGEMRIEDSFATGTVTSNSTGGVSTGSLCGNSCDIYRSYGVATVTNNTAESGGLVGFDGEIYDSFFVGNVTGNTLGDEVGFLVGELPYIFAPAYFASNYTCSNTGAGNCNDPTDAFGADDVGIDLGIFTDYFFKSTNAPLSTWDFTNVWEEQENDYPKLRRPL